MSTADFLSRAMLRARRGLHRAEVRVRKRPGVPPMTPEDISAGHWDYSTADDDPQWTQHPLIEAVHRHITGGENTFWLNWLLARAVTWCGGARLERGAAATSLICPRSDAGLI